MAASDAEAVQCRWHSVKPVLADRRNNEPRSLRRRSISSAALDTSERTVFRTKRRYADEELLADVREPLPPQPGRPRRQDCEYRRGGAGNATSSCSVSHGLPGHAPAGQRELCQPHPASSRPGRQARHQPLCQPGAGAALPLRGLAALWGGPWGGRCVLPATCWEPWVITCPG